MSHSNPWLSKVGGAVGALLVCFSPLSSPVRAETGEATRPTTAANTADISGVLIADEPPSASPARVLLVVPQAITATLALPVRGGFMLNDRQHIR